MSLTKAQVAIAAGKLQEKLDRINVNYEQALITASNRIAKKYRTILQERLLGVNEDVVKAVELPEYYFDTDVVVEEVGENKSLPADYADKLTVEEVSGAFAVQE